MARMGLLMVLSGELLMQSVTFLMRIPTLKTLSGMAVSAFSCLMLKNIDIYFLYYCTFRIEGGIPPLVELLNFFDTKVQRAAAGALKILAFKNDENKNLVAMFSLLNGI
jgi:hypothetical protein